MYKIVTAEFLLHKCKYE